MSKNISDLKKLLSGGLHKNKYLLELTAPIVGTDSNKLNVLCKSASFPERTIGTNQIWHYGRRYSVRAETDYSGTWTLTFLDDNKASLRKFFDSWLSMVDDSSTPDLIDISSYENGVASILNTIKAFGDGISQITSSILDQDFATALASYQNEINIWALNYNNEKVYGYKFQNVFPTNISSVEFSDSESNSLLEFTVTFTYSEFVTISNLSLIDSLASTLFGDGSANTISTVEDIFD